MNAVLLSRGRLHTSAHKLTTTTTTKHFITRQRSLFHPVALLLLDRQLVGTGTMLLAAATAPLDRGCSRNGTEKLQTSLKKQALRSSRGVMFSQPPLVRGRATPKYRGCHEHRRAGREGAAACHCTSQLKLLNSITYLTFCFKLVYLFMAPHP